MATCRGKRCQSVLNSSKVVITMVTTDDPRQFARGPPAINCLLGKVESSICRCLVTLYYYLCLTEAVRPMFVQLQQELHPHDIDAVVMRRKMTSCLLMFVWRHVCLAHAAPVSNNDDFFGKILHLKPHPNFAVVITNSLTQYCNRSRG